MLIFGRAPSGLEISKRFLEDQCKRNCTELGQVDLFLAERAQTAVWHSSFQYDQSSCFTGAKFQNNISGRKAVIDANAHLNSFDLCKRLDVQDIPVLEHWKDEFPKIDSWVSAYSEPVCRKRIHKMFSQIKRELRLP